MGGNSSKPPPPIWIHPAHVNSIFIPPRPSTNSWQPPAPTGAVPKFQLPCSQVDMGGNSSKPPPTRTYPSPVNRTFISQRPSTNSWQPPAPTGAVPKKPQAPAPPAYRPVPPTTSAQQTPPRVSNSTYATDFLNGLQLIGQAAKAANSVMELFVDLPADNAFLQMNYPHVVLKNSDKVAERINANVKNFVYLSNKLEPGKKIVFEVEKAEHGDFDCGFNFGVTTCSRQTIMEQTSKHLEGNCVPRSSCRGHSSRFRVYNARSVGCKVTFERRMDGTIDFWVNSGKVNQMFFSKPGVFSFAFESADLWPFIQLNGFVSKIKILSADSMPTPVPSDIVYASPARARFQENCPQVQESRPQVQENRPRVQENRPQVQDNRPTPQSRPTAVFPATDWSASDSVAVIDGVILQLVDLSDKGHVINYKPMHAGHQLLFQVRHVRPFLDSTLSFALIESSADDSHESRPGLGRITDALYAKNFLRNPQVGLRFSILRQHDGKMSLKVFDSGNEPRVLFTAHRNKSYFPLFLLDGSVTSLELLPQEPKVPRIRESRTNQNGASWRAEVPSNRQNKSSQRSGPGSQNAKKQVPKSSGPDESKNECQICFDGEVNCTFVSCGHARTCYPCGLLLFEGSRECPFCRQVIEKVIKIYN